MTHENATRALQAASLFSAAVGFAMVLALLPGLGSALGFLIDLMFLPVDGAQGFASDGERLLGAISGGVLAGLGVMSWQVATHVYADTPDLGGRIIMIGILTWFVTDSTGSVMSGAWFNVVPNIGFLALFMAPLLLAKHKTRTGAA